MEWGEEWNASDVHGRTWLHNACLDPALEAHEERQGYESPQDEFDGQIEDWFGGRNQAISFIQDARYAEAGKECANRLDHDGKTALYYACIYRDEQVAAHMVCHLLSLDARKNTDYWFTNNDPSTRLIDVHARNRVHVAQDHERRAVNETLLPLLLQMRRVRLPVLRAFVQLRPTINDEGARATEGPVIETFSRAEVERGLMAIASVVSRQIRVSLDSMVASSLAPQEDEGESDPSSVARGRTEHAWASVHFEGQEQARRTRLEALKEAWFLLVEYALMPRYRPPAPEAIAT